MKKSARKWAKKQSPLYRRKAKLKCKYNLTLEQYDKMFAKQDGVCKVCKRINISGRRLAIDHDHRTGKVRGLLCDNCNRTLGCVKDSIGTLSKLIAYLKEYSNE